MTHALAEVAPLRGCSVPVGQGRHASIWNDGGERNVTHEKTLEPAVYLGLLPSALRIDQSISGCTAH